MVRSIGFFGAVTLWTVLVSAAVSNYYDVQEVQELTVGKLADERLENFVGKISFRAFDPLGYKNGAKPAMFGDIDLERDGDGYFIKDVYCNKKVRSRVGPNRIPANNVMNVEHTWPQSRGSGREPAKSDLHHLFPSDSRANSTRGNVSFGEVSGEPVDEDCRDSSVGEMLDPESGVPMGERAYQPPVEHRGNVARAMFYASVHYGYDIPENEEYYLKRWSFEDPVDKKELERNDLIEAAQGNRNPFVDFPEAVQRIEDF